MKRSEFRALIREEIKRVMHETRAGLLRENNEAIDLSKEFAVVERGGNIGSQSDYVPQFKGRIVKTFDTAAEAKEYAKQRRSRLSPGEKSYYRMTYVVVRNLKSNMKKD